MNEFSKVEKRDQRTIYMIMIVLIAYNVFFLVCAWFPTSVSGSGMKIYDMILKNRFIIGLLEFLGVATLFADLVIGFDKRKGAGRIVKIVIIGLLVSAFIFKIYMTYLLAYHDANS